MPPFPPFDPHQDRSTVGQRWRKWINRFQNLLISLREFDSKVKRGLLLTYVGEATNDIFDTLPETGDDYDTPVAKLTTYFEPTSNTDMAIFEFREMKQERGETLNAFYRRLKEKATRCEFHDEDREIKTHIIHKTTDSRLRRKALRETMTLNELLKYGNTLEKTDIESKKIERTQESSSPSNQAYSIFIISNAINNKDRDITLKQKINKRPRLAHVTLHVNSVEIAEDNFHTKEAKQNALHTAKPAINATKSVISPSTVYLALKRQLQKMIKRKFDSSRQQ